MSRLFAHALALLLSFAPCAAAAILPGEAWLDTDGARIQAHGGGMLIEDGVYYWYGEDKRLGNLNRTGVSCYSSRDLVTWKNEGVVLPKSAMPEEFRDRGICERPKVVRSPKTGAYVMWMHLDDQRYHTASAGVAVADRPTGPFVFERAFRPIGPGDNPQFAPPAGDRCRQAELGATYRDMNLFADDDGTAYVLYASEDNATLYICRLNPECTDVERPAVHGTTWSRNLIGQSREAPAPFKCRGAYYLVTSACTGWHPNPCRLATAPRMLGPWQDRGEIFAGGADARRSFHSQSSSVIPAPGKPEGCFVYLGDRWFPDALEDSRYVWWPLVVRPDGTARVYLFHAWDWAAFDAIGTIADPACAYRVIPVDFAVDRDTSGGIVTADMDADGAFDFAVTASGHIGAYRHDAKRLWHREVDVRVSAGSSENAGLPGHHAPGVQVADVDGDGKPELLYLDQGSTVHILDAATGGEERRSTLPHPEGTERWEHLVVANLRGLGDRDLIVQATNAMGYRIGRFVAAYAIERLDDRPLWSTDRFGALAHGPLRIADLDGDGRDEVCGFKILGPDGKEPAWRYPAIDPANAGGASFHIDSLFVADVRPDLPGLELALLEEGRNYVALLNLDRGVVWWKTNGRQEPQNAAVGEFDPSRAGLEVWCRSRYDTHQKPWVLDANGDVIAQYAMDDVAPYGWTEKGVEVIFAIDWTGGPAQLAAAKERHRSGDVCIFEPASGKFAARFFETADRLYVADVSGDWREELIVASGRRLHIYENTAPNPRPDRPRLWERNDYRRSKMSWNYYSP